MSSTLPNWLLENITIEGGVNDHLVKVWRYFKAVNRVSNENIGTHVEWSSRNNFEDNIFTLVTKFLSNINKGKISFIFSSKKKIRQIYESFFENKNEVCMVEADIKREMKTMIFFRL